MPRSKISIGPRPSGEDASYQGELGATTQIHSVGLKGSARF